MGRGWVRITLAIALLGLVFFSGCASLKTNEQLRQENAQLKAELEKLRAEHQKQIEELTKAKDALIEQLKKELEEGQAKVELQSRGLVLTLQNKILFDPGKAVLKEECKRTLDKIAKVIKESVEPDAQIMIEGHTDNQPIKYSGWKSNWELSAARALSVLHYLEGRGIEPDRMCAVGYGEYKPVASNATEEGRQLNRRVEIVVVPKGWGTVEEIGK